MIGKWFGPARYHLSAKFQMRSRLPGISEESRLAFLLAIPRRIGGHLHAGAKGAEEAVLLWINHDSYVATPGDQVPSFWLAHPLKSPHSVIQLVGWSIRVMQSGAGVEVVHQMRTIQSGLG